MRRNQLKIFSALVMLGTSVFVLTSHPGAGRRTEDAGKDGAQVGLVSTSRQPLPAHRLANVNQQEVPADELKKGRVLLVYLTTSCQPCIDELKTISRLHEAGPPGLRIYGISFERPARVENFVREFDIRFPVLIDMSAQLAKALDLRHFPTTFLVEDGVITKVWRGATRDEAALYRQLGVH